MTKTYLKNNNYHKKDINKKWIDIGNKRIVQIGHGSIGGCMIELYLRHIKMNNPDQIIVLEMNEEHIPKKQIDVYLNM
jgi:homospermidine synthase